MLHTTRNSDTLLSTASSSLTSTTDITITTNEITMLTLSSKGNEINEDSESGVSIEFVNEEFITQDVYLLDRKFINYFPYIKEVDSLYDKEVYIPNRKVGKLQLEQLVYLIDIDCADSLILNNICHYDNLKLCAEFLLADVIVDRLNDLLCQQLTFMSCNEIAQFHGLHTDEQQQKANRDKLDDLLATYFTSLS